MPTDRQAPQEDFASESAIPTLQKPQTFDINQISSDRRIVKIAFPINDNATLQKFSDAYKTDMMIFLPVSDREGVCSFLSLTDSSCKLANSGIRLSL